MRQHSLLVGIFAVACGLAATTPSQAAMQTWVAGNGNNAGNCQIKAPCKTFAYAHNQTDAGGAINVLSSGNFGPVTITKAISIVAEGVETLISNSAGGAAINVQAGASDVISLRGLTIDLNGNGDDGISFASGAALHVHNSVIRRTTNGITFFPASGTSEFYITDSLITESNDRGIEIVPTGSASAKGVLDRVRVENGSVSGIIFSGESTTGSIAATVRDSVTAGHTSSGIFAGESGSGTTVVMVDHSAAVDNGTGINVQGAGATVRIGDSTVSGNSQGLFTSSGGAIDSYVTNQVNGNGTDGAPTGTIVMK